VKPSPSSAFPAASQALESHREALEEALRQGLATSQPALRRQALARAARHLIHPALLLDSPLLADRHPWRLDAQAIADAFEAVTNGMETPGVLEALDDLSDDSPFQSWRHLVLALHFFYEGLDEAVEAHLALLEATSPPAHLARVLTTLVQDPGPRRALPGALGRLADQVAQADPRIRQWVQDLAEGLETDDEGLFWEALAAWLDAVADEAPDRARSAVLWAWTQLEWHDFDEAELLDLAAEFWGRAEAFRLAALGTLAWDPEGSSLLWLRFLLGALRDEALDDDEVARARIWADRFRAAARASGPLSAEGERTELALLRAWNQEAEARGRGDWAWPLPAPRDTAESTEPSQPDPALVEAEPGTDGAPRAEGVTRAGAPAAPARPAAPPSHPADGQLDLFGF